MGPYIREDGECVGQKTGCPTCHGSPSCQAFHTDFKCVLYNIYPGF